MQITTTGIFPRTAPSKLYTLALLSIFSILPGMATADVYKCVVGKSTVYQNLPCADEAEAKPYVNNGNRAGVISSSTDVRSLSLAELAASIKMADEITRNALVAHETAMHGISRNDYEGQRRVRETYGARLSEASRRGKILYDELYRRCSGGFREDGRSCRQKGESRE